MQEVAQSVCMLLAMLFLHLWYLFTSWYCHAVNCIVDSC